MAAYYITQTNHFQAGRFARLSPQGARPTKQSTKNDQNVHGPLVTPLYGNRFARTRSSVLCLDFHREENSTPRVPLYYTFIPSTGSAVEAKRAPRINQPAPLHHVTRLSARGYRRREERDHLVGKHEWSDGHVWPPPHRQLRS